MLQITVTQGSVQEFAPLCYERQFEIDVLRMGIGERNA